MTSEFKFELIMSLTMDLAPIGEWKALSDGIAKYTGIRSSPVELKATLAAEYRRSSSWEKIARRLAKKLTH